MKARILKMLLSVLLIQTALAVNCVLVVPDDPLSALGLSTPYILKGCDQATPKEETFAEAVIFDSDANTIAVYHPLVITEGTEPGIDPVVPDLPTNAVVGIWFASNADSFELVGDGTIVGNCFNGIADQKGENRFEDLSFCNAVAFFQASKDVTLPALGKAKDGGDCLTTRDFSLVDQEQADNVNTEYLLLTATNTTAQNTEVNRNDLNRRKIDFTVLLSGFDNRLVPIMDQALGCGTIESNTLDDGINTSPSLALNEMFANAFQVIQAFVPEINPLTFREGNPDLSLELLDGYRAGVNQPSSAEEDPSGELYCNNMNLIAPNRYKLMQPFIELEVSPNLKDADNLLNFLCSRFEKTFTQKQPLGLECNIITGQTSRVFALKNEKGQAIACTIDGVTFPDTLKEQAAEDIQKKLDAEAGATGKVVSEDEIANLKDLLDADKATLKKAIDAFTAGKADPSTSQTQLDDLAKAVIDADTRVNISKAALEASKPGTASSGKPSGNSQKAVDVAGNNLLNAQKEFADAEALLITDDTDAARVALLAAFIKRQAAIEANTLAQDALLTRRSLFSRILGI
jgi:hypothetical protein